MYTLKNKLSGSCCHNFALGELHLGRDSERSEVAARGAMAQLVAAAQWRKWCTSP